MLFDDTQVTKVALEQLENVSAILKPGEPFFVAAGVTPTTWTVLEEDGSNHLVSWCNAHP